MLEISGEDIKHLSDVDLRALIGLLCEAELYSIGLPTSGVTWGGHHNAKDGGLDVRVELNSTFHNDSYIPRSNTGFQVKKPDMPSAKIKEEMRPDGELREVINELAAANGAYIIVSSQGSTSDLALMKRRRAMQEAISDSPYAATIKLDFYDRDRVAAWVRCHPSLILWVRGKIGRPIQGWRPFENWSNPLGELNEEYLTDGHIRLYSSTTRLSEGLSVKDGINNLRVTLNKPGSVVRLVGLSGVGKTRLLQALFDERIGENALDKTKVFYCDIANRPIPDPQNFAEQLVATRKYSLLAIDNCPPSLHKPLTTICLANGSQVSLITIEYDVREDQPEETEVFRLEPASKEIVEKVIQIRFPHINEVCTRIVANFSGGNARIAIALCKTISHGDDVSHLKDEDLFTRLFLQRNEPSDDLFSVAKVCSLVYSFNCQIDQGKDGELEILSSIIGIPVLKLYQFVKELQRRELVQQRGIWRAVLPHAVANRLAKRALEDIPVEFILNIFGNRASERLMRSFSRRLRYLHDCKAAREISRMWLVEEGLLGDVLSLDSLGIDLLINVAPIDPEKTLEAIERAANKKGSEWFFSRENHHYLQITRLLRSLAYEKEMFIRSTDLLCHFALSERQNENQNSIRKSLQSLFYIKLSGTHATAVQRLSVIERLLYSKQNEKIELGFSLLSASLQAWSISSYNDFEFGAHSRDYGYFPQTNDGVIRWFKLFIDYAVNVSISDLGFSNKAMNLLAERFRELWVGVGMFDELYSAAITISKKFVWKEGWIAVKSILRYDNKEMSTEIIKQLEELERILIPSTLIERARLYAFSKGHPYDLIDVLEDDDEDPEKSYEMVDKITRSIGKEVGLNEEIYIELLPELLSESGNRLFYFGQGLAEGCSNPKMVWEILRIYLQKIDESKRNYQAVGGFLDELSLRDTQLCNDLLNTAVVDPVWSAAFPLLQSSTQLDSKGVERLKQSLVVGKAPMWMYRQLAYARRHEISDFELSELLTLISNNEEGITVSIELLYMRIHRQNVDQISKIIKESAYELISRYLFLRKDNSIHSLDSKLSTIIKICMKDRGSTELVRFLCSRLLKAFIEHDIYSTDYDDVLVALAATQPIVFMDTFLNEETIDDMYWIFHSIRPKNPLAHIDDEILLDWCKEEPTQRFITAASILMPYKSMEDNGVVCWTKLAKQFIIQAPSPVEVLNHFKESFRPPSWSGSLANILQTRLALLTELKGHENVMVAEWAIKEEVNFEQSIRKVREWEQTRDSNRNEAFE
ncbi:hypothetical protein [Paenibacillus hexagrammi]|uniref:Restriction endonuclease type IV Mrr domain-containing protein n=1 Tax=Paenibacillus hexagrammi TaxID=2908839 RepID=A0ABY3SF58_9BACL|nr:hypothetical protein [Paenibacillus sp. YPD9-1]UJF32624.1 hypothetical protein L0M14_23810 [Paenibacillus sp. YPD9-1]